MVDTNLDKYTIIIEEQDNYTIELNEQGPQGLRGPQGEVGPVGPQGEAATITIGKVETGDPGTLASVTNVGTSTDSVLNFEIPRGDKGDTGPQGIQGLRGISVTGVEQISKVGLVATYRMTFSDGTHFDYQVTDGSVDGLTREQVISLIGYEPASYTSVEGLTTRVATLEERVEDLTNAKFPNAVIIGTPHIEGGQVSNFSNTDYLQFPFVDISRGLPFDIYFSFTTGSDVVSQQNILDSYFGIALAIQNSKGVMALSSNGTSWDIGNVTGTNTILPNTTYYVKCGWTGTQYNASLSTNDTTYTPDMILNSTLTTNKTTIFIGGSPDLFGVGTAHPFKGTINFNKSRVDVQGVTVWEGMADVGLASRANVSLNNLDEVGEKRFTDIQIALDGKQDKGTAGGGLELCDIGMALYVDETKGLRRYLNGQIVDINTNTQAFLNRLKQITTLHPSLLCTEEEWQTAKTMSAFGQVGKFVFNYADDGVTVVSVRIPRVVNVQGLFDLQNLGMTVEAGLPDHLHKVSRSADISNENITTETSGSDTISNYNGAQAKTTSNASLSNPIYGRSTTVQPEAIQYPYFIQIATGSETEANIVNTLENVNGFTLLESKYSDKPLYNESWLLSNGQWNSKAVYPTAYEGLQVEYNSEIEAGTTVTLPSGVSYTKRGLSVKLSTEEYTDYDFRLNTADETFRLPLLDGSEDLPSDNAQFVNVTATEFTMPYNGYLYLVAEMKSDNVCNLLVDGVEKWHFTVSTSYFHNGGSTTFIRKGQSIKLNGTYFYKRYEKAQGNGSLYFYVGETVQNANLIDAGRIGEELATKTDILQASGASMPSNKYINLTLGASGSTYTAPANGWVCASGHVPTINQWGKLRIYATKIAGGTNYSTSSLSNGSGPSGAYIDLILPVKKGYTFSLQYIGAMTADLLRFWYAVGSESEAS